MKRPAPTAGMHHIAMYAGDLDAAEHFYVELMGMQVEWRPDPDNVYLTSGNDNLALHKAPEDFSPGSSQKLDHIGFIIRESEQVDDWYEFLLEHKVEMKTKPKTHRDGARSFYCLGPDRVIVQIIYHPPIANI